MARYRIAFVGLALAVFSLASCQSSRPTSAEGDDAAVIQTVQQATDAYIAYERGDCETVEILARPTYLDSWQSNEVLYSLLLLQGFCRELDDDATGAQTLYRELISRGPASFAAEDARERLRVLERLERDSSYASWIAGARSRTDPKGDKRKPLERSPARFPPMAKVAGIEGYAVVEFGITPTGETEDPVVVDATPPLIFDGTTVRAIRDWVFEGARNKEADDRQIIRIVFKPDSTDSKSPPADASE